MLNESEIREYKVIKADRQINHTRYKVGNVISLPVNVACYYDDCLELIDKQTGSEDKQNKEKSK